MAVSEKVQRLIDLLHKRTVLGQLDWIFPTGDGRPHLILANRILSIATGSGYDEEPYIYVSIHNTSGELIETVSDGSLAGQKPSNGMDSYWTLLSELYELAVAKAKGLDENLDAILEELEGQKTTF